MARFRIAIEYDGGPYVGWQRQDNGPSVQAAIEAALAAMTGEKALVFGAGRTDAGVHARAQVAHFDLAGDWPADKLRDGLNFHLKPQPVSILSAARVADDFHARFSATGRHYLYRIICRRSPLALDHGRAWLVPRPLDAGRMAEAAGHLVGHHDFTTFRSSQCQAKSPVKTLDALSVSSTGGEVEIRASARSFLHNQVRSLAGTLKLVGEGVWSPGDVADALAARDRARCGALAPPWGLYFMSVDYRD